MLSYPNRDYESILKNLIEQIPQLTDKWTDYNKADLGMVLLQTLAGVSAMAHFYIDKESNENFIGLAKESKNIESILELIGYQKPLRECAMSTQVIQAYPADESSISRVQDIVFPKYYQIYDKDKKTPCFLLNEVRIRPNETYKEVPIYQGICRAREFTNQAITGYKFYLPSGNYAKYPFRLIIDGTEWEQVDNAFLALEGGRKFSLHRDAYDSHYILLTHDYESYITYDGSFTIEYVLTEGDIKIDALNINNIDMNSVDMYGNKYSDLVTTYNKQPFVGGYTEADPYFERARLQRQLKVMDRLVTLEDYNNFISSYPGVIDCEISDISVRNTTNPKPYQVDVFILCNTLTNMNDAFKTKLMEDIRAKQDFRNEVFLKDGKRVYVDLDIEFTTKASSFEVDTIANRIVQTIRDNYATLRFKKPILIDEILSIVLRSVPEVYTIDILSPTYDVYPSIGEVIMLRDINVNGGVYRYGY